MTKNALTVREGGFSARVRSLVAQKTFLEQEFCSLHRTL